MKDEKFTKIIEVNEIELVNPTIEQAFPKLFDQVTLLENRGWEEISASYHGWRWMHPERDDIIVTFSWATGSWGVDSPRQWKAGRNGN